MRKRTKASIVGMTIGVVIVTALGMMTGLELIPALAIAPLGVFLGGWIAERMVGEEETFATEETASRGTS